MEAIQKISDYLVYHLSEPGLLDYIEIDIKFDADLFPIYYMHTYGTFLHTEISYENDGKCHVRLKVIDDMFIDKPKFSEYYYTKILQNEIIFIINFKIVRNEKIIYMY